MVSLLAILLTGVIPRASERVRRLSIERQHFVHIAHRIRPFTRRLDRFVKSRLTILVPGLTVRGLALVCIVLGLLVIPLDLVPFAVVAPGSAVALIGIGLSGHDGLWVIAGIIPAVAGFWLVYAVLT